MNSFIRNAKSSCNYCRHTNTSTDMMYINANPFENDVYLTCETNMHCATIDERISQLMPSSTVISENWRCDINNVLSNMYRACCVEYTYCYCIILELCTSATIIIIYWKILILMRTQIGERRL